ncbi:unnamed protein product [Microthlaspi erraticum]|uniref:Uncharacterized protein n=1 Tax=Microthlaspi erraticum TaxID=1685480 RepID=A0A6D2KX90_9BRAS|nr:unnamed protein product [Microthlaspi erraticum]
MQNWNVGVSAQWEDIIALLLDENQEQMPLFILRYAFQATVYWLWRERNGRRHGEAPTPPSRMKQIDKQIRNRFSSIRTLGDRRYEHGLQTWFANL